MLRFAALLCGLILAAVAINHLGDRVRIDAGARTHGVERRSAAIADRRPDPSATASATQASGAPAAVQVARARGDGAYLRSLLERYRAQTEPGTKRDMLAVLGAVANEDLLRHALEMTGSQDAGARQDGFELLAFYSLEHPDVRMRVLQRLEIETDAEATQDLARMLAPARMPAGDASAVVDRLHALTAHPDAGVRSEALRQLLQWRGGRDAEAVLHRALHDPAMEMRLAAIEGVSVSDARSQPLKDALLAIAADAGADAGERRSALSSLRGFRLSGDESRLLHALAMGEADAGGHDE